MDMNLAELGLDLDTSHSQQPHSHHFSERVRPSIFRFDYLALRALTSDLRQLIRALPKPDAPTVIAVDIGCGTSPYRTLLENQGFQMKTLDVSDRTAPDFVGTVEDTRLPDEFSCMVLCTQVLEHSLDPLQGLREIYRVLQPGGHLIVTVPHIWFYHPHPSDNWRFTQEGLLRLVRRAQFVPLRLLSQGGSALSYFQITNFLLYGVLGKLAAPIYLLNNLLGLVADRLVRNDLFCLNFALLARKPVI